VKEPKFKTYECRYFHDGKWWAFDIQAPSYPDAEARVCKLGNAQIVGEVVATIRIKTGWVARLIAWVTGLFIPRHL
jgi:hypothetical protein